MAEYRDSRHLVEQSIRADYAFCIVARHFLSLPYRTVPYCKTQTEMSLMISGEAILMACSKKNPTEPELARYFFESWSYLAKHSYMLPPLPLGCRARIK